MSLKEQIITIRDSGKTNMLDSYMAVSYTHLDVYKRQVLYLQDWQKNVKFP